jgi:tRNA threonylcarbamoyladenosine biosynthesis protein TsaE
MNRSDPFRFTSSDESDTVRLGRALADAVRPGDVIALHGQLGAGKTRLVQAVAKALGCGDQLVNSPTFILIQEYDGRLPVYHVDAYRLKDCDEFLEIGGEEILGGDGVCLIEWAEKVTDALPRDHVDVAISVTGEQTRSFEFRAAGVRSDRMIDAIRNALK